MASYLLFRMEGDSLSSRTSFGIQVYLQTKLSAETNRGEEDLIFLDG